MASQQIGFRFGANIDSNVQTTSNRQAWTVTQLTVRVKGLLEGTIGEVWIKGEISGFKPSASGHVYFSVKDSGAVLSCAMFRASSGKLKFEPKDGLEVLVHGKISVYPPRGNYQLIVDAIEPVGAGSLALAFEQLKAKLSAEGLFDASRKQPIPAYPTRVVIITSPTGAALQDMLNVLGRRNAGISVLVVPALVQGDQAAPQLIRGLQIADQYKLGDVIVLARGGGSMEDLWCFNDENLVRAIASCSLPVISAVGHEVDFTLADFAADLRAPTPSAAAELVSRSRLELVESLTASQRRLTLAISGRLSRIRATLLSSESKLISPAERLARARRQVVESELKLLRAIEGRIPILRQQLDELAARSVRLVERSASERRRALEAVSGRLDALSPLHVLGRGYALVHQPSGALLKSAKEARTGSHVTLVFHDGKANAQVI